MRCVALAVADRAYVLEMGSIALTGKSSDLASDPGIIETYLGIGGRKTATPQ
jgi:branched-chain amino acid transport system ATP-binding protein